MWGLSRGRATVIATVGAAALVAAGWGAPAQAQEDATDTTTANVTVGGVITIEDLDEDFTITGEPGDTAATDTPVSLTVTTNNPGGYSVTVQPTGPTLDPETVGNPDSIPFTDLEVETEPAVFTALDPDNPVTVHTQTDPSAEEGDTLTQNYQLEIPFVEADTYSGDITYVASATL